MSLISFKNLAGPLQGWRFATIILVAVLFAVFRYSGGAIQTTSRGGELPVEPYAPPDTVPKASLSAAPHKAHGAPAFDPRAEIGRLGRKDAADLNDGTRNAGGDLLHELIGDQKPLPPKQKEEEKSASKLEDIEKSLGLR